MSLPSLLSQHLLRRPQRIALLQHVAEQGSITRAAKSAGLSYKAAWDAIDELNNLANAPLVERAVGGKGGGGAHLSAEGERVLRLYLKLQALQAQVLEAAEEASDLDLLGRLMLRTSARNQLRGTVSAITAQGGNDLIHLDVGAGLQIDAQITHESTVDLELRPGTEVVALMKAGWLTLSSPASPVPPQHNVLQGAISRAGQVENGCQEVRVRIANGQTLCAMVAADSSLDFDSTMGSAVVVAFSPSNVLIGITL